MKILKYILKRSYPLGRLCGAIALLAMLFAGAQVVNGQVAQPTTGVNYVTTHTPKVPGFKGQAVVQSQSVDQVRATVNYFDGLGRVAQQVNLAESPGRKDVVQPVVYDAWGRQAVGYLPYTEGSSGAYKSFALGDPSVSNADPLVKYRSGTQYSFYQQAFGVAHDVNPYAVTTFELSPLSRPVKQGGPGAAWQPDQKYVKSDYLVNAHGTTAGKERIPVWDVDNTGNLISRSAVTGYIESGGYYSSGQLTIRQTTDEDGHSVREYTDKSGRVILKKVQVLDNAPDLNNDDQWACTYYVYNGYGDLMMILPPEATRAVKAGLNSLNNWAFQYKYDKRRRVIGKKLPGADWMYSVYDDRDRVVMTQDGEQRKVNKWSYVLYDAFNRTIITGIYTHNSSIDQVAMSALISTTVFHETLSSGTNHGYTNTVFASTGFVASGFSPQTVVYYDNYSAIIGLGNEYVYMPAQIAPVTLNGYQNKQPDAAFNGVVGQVTGLKVKTLEDQPTWLYTVNYYDDKYRLIQRVSDNLKGGIDRLTNLYDYTGKVLTTKNVHSTGKLTWQNMVAVKVDGDNLVKTGSSATWGTSGASSAEQIPANTNGWVEMTAGDVGTRRMFGLSVQDTDQHFSSIKYGLYLDQSTLLVQVDGKTMKVSYPIALGDRLRIVRENGYVRFYKNGMMVYPLDEPEELPCTDALLVDVALHTYLAKISRARFSAGQVVSQTVVTRYQYDHADRLLKTWHKLNDGAEVLLAQNEYNEVGQLINKNLHSTDVDGTADNARSFKQSVDYRYNIRGWLTSINNSTLTNTADVNPDPAGMPQDLFGMELAYNQLNGTGNSALYNGNISSVKWSNGLGQEGPTENAYNYSYDPMSRLLRADFRQKKSTWGLPEYQDENGNTHTAASYSEEGYRYDLNGNIQMLKRKTARGEDMDVLAYDYGVGENSGNKLLSVTDGGNKSTGFIDGNTSGNDYLYDANGSMTSDLNKGITSILYNHLRLPSKIVKQTGEYITFTYDANGRKLRQQVFNGSAVQQKKSDYAGDCFYENDELKFINHQEGRVVISTAEPEYQYFLKDHLGNARVTFTSKPEVEQSIATMSPENAAIESEQYEHYDEALVLNAKLFDHTHTKQTARTKPEYHSVLLRGQQNGAKKPGLSKMLSVMPGDTVKMEVFAKYFHAKGNAVAGELQSALASIANGTAIERSVIDGGVAGVGATAFPFAGLLARGDDRDDAPRAYLNWIIFDRDLKFKDGGYKQISTAAEENGDGMRQHEQLAEALTMRDAGYVYIYLSNEDENPVDVVFDDFSVMLVKSPIIQVEDYYPFGLTFNSYQRENGVDQRYKFQGQEHIDDLNLGWVSFKWRNHQPDIGRFFNIDPLAEKYVHNSTYAFSENKVVAHIELEGLESVSITDKKMVTDGKPVSFDCPNCDLFKVEHTGVDGVSREQGIGNAAEFQFTISATDGASLGDYSVDIVREKEGTLSVDGKVIDTKTGSDGPHEGNKQTTPDESGVVYSADAPHLPNNALSHPSVKNANEVVLHGKFTETATVTNRQTGKQEDSKTIHWETKTVVRKDEQGKFQLVKDESYIKETQP